MAKIYAVTRRHTLEDYTAAKPFGVEQAEKVSAFHRSLPGYSVTPLVNLKNLAQLLGVRAIYIKDESKRFGLNAFKALGGSYAIARELGARLDLNADELTFAQLVRPEAKKRLGALLFVTATDGNHGRGVAWTAQRLGQRALVYMPKGSAMEALHNIQKLGADASITDLNYDDTVRLADKTARERGGIVIQDTSWDGYESIPLHIMQGYTSMAYEAVEQLGETRPTHVFLQAGVGSMAGAVAGFLAAYYRDARPNVTIVEPHNADCIYQTALADDGRLHKVGGALQTIMAGLRCGEPCALGWEQLARYADNFVSMPDMAAALGMRMLGNPVGGDAPIISGESGASAFGLAAAALREKKLRWLKEQLQLDENSVLLCFSTEGATNVENYRRVLWDGAWNWEYNE